MKTRTFLRFLLSFLAATAISIAADSNPEMGTWKLNEAESKFAPGATKFVTAVYAPADNGMFKVTLDGVDKDGKPVHDEWIGKFDGKDYPVKGDTFSDSRAYKMAGARTSWDITFKKGGKVVGTGTMVDSADGKTRTTSTKSPGAPSFDNVAVYDRQ
jgi:hypothetical protein